LLKEDATDQSGNLRSFVLIRSHCLVLWCWMYVFRNVDLDGEYIFIARQTLFPKAKQKFRITKCKKTKKHFNFSIPNGRNLFLSFFKVIHQMDSDDLKSIIIYFFMKIT